MAKIAIVGAGAIGSVVASLLQSAGHELVLCVRRPLPGLTVETPDGAVRIHASVLTDPAAAGPVDWVMMATKAYDVAGAQTYGQRKREYDTSKEDAKCQFHDSAADLQVIEDHGRSENQNQPLDAEG